jgi:hypothetical protein
LYIQWVVSNQCKIICAGRSTDINISKPILTYGLEIVIPKGKILDDIQNYYKKLLKQLLSLTINVADPAVGVTVIPL